MAEWTVSLVRMRTTNSGGGNAVGIVTGVGATAEQALNALRQQAEQRAQQAARQATEAADRADQLAAERKARRAKQSEARLQAERTRRMQEGGGRGIRMPARSPRPAQPPETADVTPTRRDWRFEVIDVRLTLPPEDAKTAGWLAYGTLTFALEGATPQGTAAGSSWTGTGPVVGSHDGRSRDGRSGGSRGGR
jgi:hypothetical protein